MARRTNFSERAMLGRVAQLAAEKAVEATFANLGIDITTPAAKIEAQELFLSLRNLKNDWQLFRNRIIVGIAGLLVTTVAAVAWHLAKGPPTVP